MRVARVTGQVVSTIKQASLNGFKLLMVCDVNPRAPAIDDARDGGDRDATYVAIDLVGVGEGELVVVAHGGAARIAVDASQAPTDAAIVAIIDSMTSGGEAIFIKE